MARKDFIEGLTALGYECAESGENLVSFKYTIPLGKFQDRTIDLGFEVPGDFPTVPPGGPHMRPHLLPINPQQQPHPNGGIHGDSKFGAEWQYWSRPFEGWGKSDQTVKTYMAHIRRLFDQ